MSEVPTGEPPPIPTNEPQKTEKVVKTVDPETKALIGKLNERVAGGLQAKEVKEREIIRLGQGAVFSVNGPMREGAVVATITSGKAENYLYTKKGTPVAGRAENNALEVVGVMHNGTVEPLDPNGNEKHILRADLRPQQPVAVGGENPPRWDTEITGANRLLAVGPYSREKLVLATANGQNVELAGTNPKPMSGDMTGAYLVDGFMLTHKPSGLTLKPNLDDTMASRWSIDRSDLANYHPHVLDSGESENEDLNRGKKEAATNEYIDFLNQRAIVDSEWVNGQAGNLLNLTETDASALHIGLESGALIATGPLAEAGTVVFRVDAEGLNSGQELTAQQTEESLAALTVMAAGVVGADGKLHSISQSEHTAAVVSAVVEKDQGRKWGIDIGRQLRKDDPGNLNSLPISDAYETADGQSISTSSRSREFTGVLYARNDTPEGQIIDDGGFRVELGTPRAEDIKTPQPYIVRKSS